MEAVPWTKLEASRDKPDRSVGLQPRSQVRHRAGKAAALPRPATADLREDALAVRFRPPASSKKRHTVRRSERDRRRARTPCAPQRQGPVVGVASIHARPDHDDTGRRRFEPAIPGDSRTRHQSQTTTRTRTKRNICHCTSKPTKKTRARLQRTPHGAAARRGEASARSTHTRANLTTRTRAAGSGRETKQQTQSKQECRTVQTRRGAAIPALLVPWGRNGTSIGSGRAHTLALSHGNPRGRPTSRRPPLRCPGPTATHRSCRKNNPFLKGRLTGIECSVRRSMVVESEATGDQVASSCHSMAREK